MVVIYVISYEILDWLIIMRPKKYIPCATAVLLVHYVLLKCITIHYRKLHFFYDASPNSVAVLRVTTKTSCNRHAGIIDLECYKVYVRVVTCSVTVAMSDLMKFH